ncbi:MAG: 8-oxo-dGTP diphosphatase [Clostridia bacterium]|nr:8-oxo-dGTP diphosphatase [Clostridia bacterium]MBO4883789.1 8-oxo-dGTP diphosphatase [Clostridia bacterium]
MSRTEIVTFTNMCMVRDGNRVVVQNRIDPGWPGIVLPGGHVEEGESFTAAVIREVFEETGLTIEAPRLCGVKDWYDENGRYVVLLYQADRFSGELRSSSEGEVFWADLGELPRMKLAGSMAETLRVFLEDDLSELQYFPGDGAWTCAFR